MNDKEKLWSRVNFICCAIALSIVIALFALSVLLHVKKIDLWICLYVFIALIVAAVADIAVLITSWAKLRKIKNKNNNEGKKGI